MAEKDILALLREELVPAMGCTEPIAVAYAAAVARELLGNLPDLITVRCSGNIIKNVKGVIVPGTGDLKGVDTSAILGCISGNAGKKLEVLSNISQADVEYAKELIASKMCKVELIENEENLYIDVLMTLGDNSSEVVLAGTHTNIIKTVRNGQIVFESEWKKNKMNSENKYSLKDLYDYSNHINISEIQDVLDQQIKDNLLISEEGIKNTYGANIGKTLIQFSNDSIETIARAYAAAGSDARMGGCELPVVINSGSGNQGITVSVPVIKYAEYLNVSKEKLYKALVFSNLVSIYIKTGIGKLSAYCGVVSASCGAVAGVCYLFDDSMEIISKTVTNTLGNISGIICDGAKSSCAAKIATSLEAAFLGRKLALNGNVFREGEGLTGKCIDKTIENIWDLGKIGMKQTDIEILKLMISEGD